MKIIAHDLDDQSLKEIHILKKVESNYLLKYFGKFTFEINFYMVFEFCRVIFNFYILKTIISQCFKLKYLINFNIKKEWRFEKCN